MKITLKLFGSFRQHLPADSQGYACQVSIPAGESVTDVLERFDIPTDGIVTLVNGRTADLDRALKDGDVVAAFRALAGG